MGLDIIAAKAYQPIDPFREWGVAELQSCLAKAQAKIRVQQQTIEWQNKAIRQMIEDGATISLQEW